MDNCDVCNTDVTLCDECSREFIFDKNTSLCIVRGDDDDSSDGLIAVDAAG